MIQKKILRNPASTIPFEKWFGAIEYTPDDYKESEILPVIIYYHGLGCKGTGTAAALNVLNVEGMPMELNQGRQLPKRAIVLAPQTDGWFDEKHIPIIIDYALATYKVPKVAVTGPSNGCLASLMSVYLRGDKVSSAVACAMRAFIGTDKSKVKGLPVWILNNSGDMPGDFDRVVADLKINGANVRTTVWDSASHNSWSKTYSLPEVYDFLLTPVSSEPKPDVIGDLTAQINKEMDALKATLANTVMLDKVLNPTVPPGIDVSRQARVLVGRIEALVNKANIVKLP